MPGLRTSCGVEPAKARMRVCRFCDTTGWRPGPRVDVAPEPDQPEDGSRCWEAIANGLCGLAAVLLVVFLRVMP